MPPLGLNRQEEGTQAPDFSEHWSPERASRKLPMEECSHFLRLEGGVWWERSSNFLLMPALDKTPKQEEKGLPDYV